MTQTPTPDYQINAMPLGHQPDTHHGRAGPPWEERLQEKGWWVDLSTHGNIEPHPGPTPEDLQTTNSQDTTFLGGLRGIANRFLKGGPDRQDQVPEVCHFWRKGTCTKGGGMSISTRGAGQAAWHSYKPSRAPPQPLTSKNKWHGHWLARRIRGHHNQNNGPNRRPTCYPLSYSAEIIYRPKKRKGKRHTRHNTGVPTIRQSGCGGRI